MKHERRGLRRRKRTMIQVASHYQDVVKELHRRNHSISPLSVFSFNETQIYLFSESALKHWQRHQGRREGKVEEEKRNGNHDLYLP